MTQHQVAGSLPKIIRNHENRYEGDLRHWFATVMNHATNLRGPYHNFRHMFHVTYLCHDALAWHQQFEPGRISGHEGRVLMVSAVTHDVDHTNRAGNDDINIERATAFLKAHALKEDQLILPLIIRTIRRATRYPYVVPSDELTQIEQILRDADMSQALDPVWIQEVIFGLGQEFGKSPVAMLQLQEVFLGNVKFSTEWARLRFPTEAIDAKRAEARDLLHLAVEPIQTA